MSYDHPTPPRFDAPDDEIRAFAQRYREREPNAPCHKVALAALLDSDTMHFATVHWTEPGQPVVRSTERPA